MSDHWTVAFLGLEYAPAGQGPQAFDCWAYFRHVQRARFGRDIPALTELPDDLLAVARLIRDRQDGFDWARVEKPRKPQDGDAVLMSHRDRPHHIGVYVASVPGEAVLHCTAGVGSVLATLFHLDIASWNITDIYRPIGERPVLLTAARST